MPSRVQGKTPSWNIQMVVHVHTETSLASSTRPNEKLGVQTTITAFLTLWPKYGLSLSGALSQIPFLTVLTLLITVLAPKVH